MAAIRLALDSGAADVELKEGLTPLHLATQGCRRTGNDVAAINCCPIFCWQLVPTWNLKTIVEEDLWIWLEKLTVQNWLFVYSIVRNNPIPSALDHLHALQDMVALQSNK